MLRLEPTAILLALGLLGCGPGEPGPVEGEPCARAEDCGPAGDAVCLGGRCRVYDAASGYGSIKADLSFGRDMYQVAASGFIHLFHGRLADGSELACAALLDGQLKLDDPLLNRLTVQAKYLEFHWAHGGTFFPDNLVQFVRPAEQAIAVAEGYAQLDGSGTRTALGCEPDQMVAVDQTTELTIALAAPE